jgi:hypothetical protein
MVTLHSEYNRDLTVENVSPRMICNLCHHVLLRRLRSQTLQGVLLRILRSQTLGGFLITVERPYVQLSSPGRQKG